MHIRARCPNARLVQSFGNPSVYFQDFSFFTGQIPSPWNALTMENKMIPQYSIHEQRVQDLETGHENPVPALIRRMAFNCVRWLRNRRELRHLNDDQLRDLGLNREMVKKVCSFDLLRND
jgi:uncharacterized protein YjiS (DUF1127 family)